MNGYLLFGRLMDALGFAAFVTGAKYLENQWAFMAATVGFVCWNALWQGWCRGAKETENADASV